MALESAIAELVNDFIAAGRPSSRKRTSCIQKPVLCGVMIFLGCRRFTSSRRNTIRYAMKVKRCTPG